MPVSAEDTQQIGLGILQRIAVREKARLHKEFLTRLYELPQAQEMLICGSMALHGVYLHKRWSKDLDFEASTKVALGFQEIAAQAGLNITLREGWKGPHNSMTAVPYVFSSSSAFYPEVAIGVEIFPYEQRFVAAEHRAFTTEVGEQVMVIVKPLAEMMAAKIGCMFQRNKATDFADLWFGLSSDRCLAFQARDLIRNGMCEAGNFTPPSVISADYLLERLSRLQDTWQEDLSVYLTQVPDFAQVRGDLSRWLPLFDTQSRK
jgi:predicted nucleotidyltransferase component of viral defense system